MKTGVANVVGSNELILHFGDFENMGQQQDAEVIRISDIDFARDEASLGGSANSVQHILHLSPGRRTLQAALFNVTNDSIDITSGLFCRFALYGGASSDTACITPRGSNLLQHSNRWKLPSYQFPCAPIVVDMTLDVLGLAEGFS